MLYGRVSIDNYVFTFSFAILKNYFLNLLPQEQPERVVLTDRQVLPRGSPLRTIIESIRNLEHWSTVGTVKFQIRSVTPYLLSLFLLYHEAFKGYQDALSKNMSKTGKEKVQKIHNTAQGKKVIHESHIIPDLVHRSRKTFPSCSIAD